MKLNNPPMGREEVALRWRLKLGAYIRGLRLAKDMTQDEVTRAVGWNNKQTLSGIETARTSVPSDRIEALADTFGVDRAKFAKFVLRYQDPWTFAAIFGADADLRREIALAPTRRLAARRGPQKPAAAGRQAPAAAAPLIQT
jgi:transcriptional regulator with XRE-family HTH domain